MGKHSHKKSRKRSRERSIEEDRDFSKENREPRLKRRERPRGDFDPRLQSFNEPSRSLQSPNRLEEKLDRLLNMLTQSNAVRAGRQDVPPDSPNLISDATEQQIAFPGEQDAEVGSDPPEVMENPGMSMYICMSGLRTITSSLVLSSNHLNGREAVRRGKPENLTYLILGLRTITTSLVLSTTFLLLKPLLLCRLTSLYSFRDTRWR